MKKQQSLGHSSTGASSLCFHGITSMVDCGDRNCRWPVMFASCCPNCSMPLPVVVPGSTLRSNLAINVSLSCRLVQMARRIQVGILNCKPVMEKKGSPVQTATSPETQSLLPSKQTRQIKGPAAISCKATFCLRFVQSRFLQPLHNHINSTDINSILWSFKGEQSQNLKIFNHPSCCVSNLKTYCLQQIR